MAAVPPGASEAARSLNSFSTPDFLSEFDTKGKQATEALAKITQEELDTNKKREGQFESMWARDRAQQEKALSAEAHTLDSMPPAWNADAERQARSTGPIEAFGSIGSIFGILASAFTKTPITSALNASAAAMTAIHTKDEQAYKSAYEAWKENTSLAMKRFDIERAVFEDTNKLFETDYKGWQVKKQADATRFGDRKKLAMLQLGYDPEILEMEAKSIDAKMKMMKLMEEWEKFNTDRAAYKESAFTLSATDQAGFRTALYRGDQKNIEYYQQVSKYKKETGDEPNTEKRNEIRDHIEQSGRAHSIADQELEYRTQKYESDPNSPTYGDHEASYDRAHKEIKPPSQRSISLSAADAVELEQRSKQYETDPSSSTYGDHIASRDRASGEIASSHRKQAAEATLNDAAAEKLAKRLISGDYAATVGLGYGAAGAANRVKVLEKAAAMDPSGDWTQAHLEFTGQMQEARTLGAVEARVTSAITKAQQTATRVTDASDKVDRTQWPSLNKVLLAAEKGGGGENVLRLGIAVETFVTNYASALGQGSSVMTDFSRKRANDLLEAAYSKGQVKAAVDQMLKELDSELKGVKQAQKETSGSKAPKFTGKTATNPKTGETLRQTEDGKWVP